MPRTSSTSGPSRPKYTDRWRPFLAIRQTIAGAVFPRAGRCDARNACCRVARGTFHARCGRIGAAAVSPGGDDRALPTEEVGPCGDQPDRPMGLLVNGSWKFPISGSSGGFRAAMAMSGAMAEKAAMNRPHSKGGRSLNGRKAFRAVGHPIRHVAVALFGCGFALSFACAPSPRRRPALAVGPRFFGIVVGRHAPHHARLSGGISRARIDPPA